MVRCRLYQAGRIASLMLLCFRVEIVPDLTASVKQDIGWTKRRCARAPLNRNEQMVQSCLFVHGHLLHRWCAFGGFLHPPHGQWLKLACFKRCVCPIHSRYQIALGCLRNSRANQQLLQRNLPTTIKRLCNFLFIIMFASMPTPRQSNLAYVGWFAR